MIARWNGSISGAGRTGARISSAGPHIRASELDSVPAWVVLSADRSNIAIHMRAVALSGKRGSATPA
ncbi:hypothetical protein MEX01_30990 [Methylorubrum extorquens]|nr:hypothetical protein MEX01_30990 [Methylorubrum extorquens]